MIENLKNFDGMPQALEDIRSITCEVVTCYIINDHIGVQSDYSNSDNRYISLLYVFV